MDSVSICSTQTICHHIYEVAKVVLPDKARQWVSELSTIARSIKSENDVLKVKFSEAGVYGFTESCLNMLEKAGFISVTKDVLSTFCGGLKDVLTLLMNTPEGLTDQQYECKARLH